MEETKSARTPVEWFNHNATKIGSAFTTADKIVSSVPPQVAPHLESYEDDAEQLRKRITVARFALFAIRSDVEQHRRTTSETSAHATAFAFTEEVLRAYDEADSEGREPWCDDGGFRYFRDELESVKSKFPTVSQMRQAAISERLIVSQRLTNAAEQPASDPAPPALNKSRRGRPSNKSRDAQLAILYSQIQKEGLTDGEAAKQLITLAESNGIDLKGLGEPGAIKLIGRFRRKQHGSQSTARKPRKRRKKAK